jgi:hypothetical protein
VRIYRYLQNSIVATRTGLENVPYHSVRFCVGFVMNAINHLRFYMLHRSSIKECLLAKIVVRTRAGDKTRNQNLITTISTPCADSS